MLHQTVSNFLDINLPTNTRAIILDFDNTCYLYDPCHTAALTTVETWFQKEFGPCPDWEAEYKRAQKIVKNRIPEQGASHSRILYFKTMLENMAIQDSITHSLAMERLYWDTFKTTMEPVPGLLEFLALCQENGTKVVVVSDLTTAIQCEKISHLGISSYIDSLVTSEEVGVEKPDARCFTLALDKAGVEPANAVVIGDSYERDIIGAEALGIPSILITHDSHPETLAL